MKITYRLLVKMVHSGKPCDCDPLSTCFNAKEVMTDVRNWDELIQLMKDTTHMDATILRMDELILKLQGE